MATHDCSDAPEARNSEITVEELIAAELGAWQAYGAREDDMMERGLSTSDDAILAELADQADGLFYAVLEARPTDPAGRAAQLRWIVDELRHEGGMADYAAALDHLAARLPA